MTISSLVDLGQTLCFAKVVCVNVDNPKVPWIICHRLNVQTQELIKPLESIFINAQVLNTKYQFYRIGPFFTPYELDLTKWNLPKMGDILLGKTGTNSKGTIYTSYIPTLWASPMFYFFHHLINAQATAQIFHSRNNTLKLGLVGSLSVQYGTVWDERLYDLLVLILFDNYTQLLEICRFPKYQNTIRKWNLHNNSQHKSIGEFLQVSNIYETLHLPNAAEFVAETSFLLQEPTLVSHFKSLLETSIQEHSDQFPQIPKEWIQADNKILNIKDMNDLCAF